jgi:hypothetical protein
MNDLTAHVNAGQMPYAYGPGVVPIYTLRNKTNQEVINLFDQVFGKQLLLGSPAYITKLVQALSDGYNILSVRSAQYLGPAIEEMVLSQADKAKLIAASV